MKSTVSRRALMAQLTLMSATIALAGRAAAQSVTYQYDELGRLKKATYPNNTNTDYAYDAAGNRTQLTTSAPFTATITISGAGPVDLRALANTSGYSGGDANITFVNAGTLTGNPDGGVGLDTGTWPSGYTINLTLNNSGTIRGGGGAGGAGTGGDAIYARVSFAINNTGGTIQGGGGGGGAGGTWRFMYYDAEGGLDHIDCYYSGGGGGGWPNGSGGSAYNENLGNPVGTPNAGSAASVGGGGAGGAGGSAGTGRTIGTGGTGGGIAAVGGDGALATGTETSGTLTRLLVNGSVGGGPAGYAVRKNGNTVTRTGGTVAGAEG